MRSKLKDMGVMVPVRWGGLLSFGIAGLICAGMDSARSEVGSWAVELSLIAPATGLVDLQNTLGVLPGATDGFDIFDVCEDGPGPPPGATQAQVYVNLSFLHPEFKDIEPGITERCSQDVRAPFDASKEWALQIETNVPSVELVLSWDLAIEGALLPSEYRVELKDAIGQVVADLRQQSEYAFQSGDPPDAQAYFLAIINDPPAAPMTVGIEASDRAVELGWSRSPDPDVSGYYIVSGTQSGFYSDRLDVGDVDEYQIGELINGVTYYFRIGAVDRTGLEGVASEEVAAMPYFSGDFDGNEWIDYVDLMALAQEWFVPDSTADMTFDGEVKWEDILLLERRWHSRR